MTEAEEFNRDSAEQWDMTADNRDIEFMFEKDEFEAWLHRSRVKHNKKRTARSIYTTLTKAEKVFTIMGGTISIKTVTEFRNNREDADIAPSTINSDLNSIATYVQFLAEKYGEKLLSFRVRRLTVQPKQYIDNVISRADYDFMVEEARKDLQHPNVYLAIRIMGTTGVRRCELLQVKVEHIRHGYIDVLGKGAKRRRIYFPKRAREEILEFLERMGVTSGYVIRRWKVTAGKTGDLDAFSGSTRSDDIKEIRSFERLINFQIRRFGQKLGLDEDVLHPHGFRHFFAKEFLKNRLDISLLADLLGHSSLDITRIYLKMTSREQADVVDETVTW